ncbi:MAG: hypothetical protein JSS32_06730 [Verrucomicrobia bacterium]|nr:hypothetical protein [Verrucomicrobiota bacterium]
MIWGWRNFREKKLLPPLGRIQIFSRHCISSCISQHKKRFDQFSREICYRNLLYTLEPQKADITFFLDLAKGKRADHFLRETDPVVEFRGGTEASSFLQLLDYVEKLKLHPQTVVYFVEDDYLHRDGWIDILLEGFSVEGAEYVTLYDHRDKYFLPMYKNLTSKIFFTPSCHWRTIPSTTHTFAVRYETLMRDLPIHRKYSEGRKISADHEKFSHLTKRGARLISPMPGWSTHAEPDFASPCVDWDKLLNTYV